MTEAAPILTSPPAEDIAWLRLRLTPEQKARLAEAARASGEDLNGFAVARLMTSVGLEIGASKQALPRMPRREPELPAVVSPMG